jgi:hypothetical protein
MHRIYGTPFSTVYELYVKKVERKGATVADLDTVILWLTGFDAKQLHKLIDQNVTFTEFFGAATMHPNSNLVTGVICGVRIEHIEDPLMQKIRILDKLVDEVANGRKMEKILRQQPA